MRSIQISGLGNDGRLRVTVSSMIGRQRRYHCMSISNNATLYIDNWINNTIQFEVTSEK